MERPMAPMVLMQRKINAPLVMLAAMLLLTACIRYVPARDEIKSDSTEDTGGEVEFVRFEQERRVEREKFLGERSAQFQNVAASTYAIGPGDVVDIQVFGMPDLSGRARVRPSGVISLPLLQEVEVEGLTEGDLERVLAARFKQFVKTPRVKVSIEEYKAHLVSVMGAVARPGTYPLRRSDYGILEVLSEAGGCTERASRTIIIVPESEQRVSTRQNNRPGGIELNLDEVYGNGVDNGPLLVPLMPGDAIVVPEAGTYEVTGDVKNPGSFPLSSRSSVMSAVAAAGGLEYSADVNKVELIRNVGEGKRAVHTFNLEKSAIKEGQDIPLRNGDVVRVPSQEGRHFGRQLIEFLHGIVNVGVNSR